MKPRFASLVVPASFDSFDIVRRTFLAFLPDTVDEDTRIRLGICLGEGFNNAVGHAYREEGGRVEVCVEVHADRVILDVADAGAGMTEEALARLDAGRLPDPDSTPLQEMPERGLGFGILRSVLDDVGYTSAKGRNVLRMVKQLGAVDVNS